jgi:YebC/PmpR family DNA-binding regulatory protein
MSGHSKWATIKHKKAAVDKARGKLWAKLVRNIEIAAREGGGDVNANATLRTMVAKAKAEQVPSDKIENAIKRGTGELKAESVENITYEGYAPCGVAVLVEVTTDNRNRSGAEVRTLFSRNGGSMAEPGAVGWQFERKGVIAVSKRKGGTEITEDDLMVAALDAGLEDIVDNGDAWELRCAPSNVGPVCTALSEAGVAFDSADRPMVATTAVPLATADEAKKVLKLIEALEDHDDVDEVYSNFDIADEIFAALDA